MKNNLFAAKSLRLLLGTKCHTHINKPPPKAKLCKRESLWYGPISSSFKKKTSLPEGVGGDLEKLDTNLDKLETLFEGTLENWARMIPGIINM